MTRIQPLPIAADSTTESQDSMAEPEEVRPAGEGDGSDGDGDSDEEMPVLHKRVDLVYCGGKCAGRLV